MIYFYRERIFKHNIQQTYNFNARPSFTLQDFVPYREQHAVCRKLQAVECLTRFDTQWKLQGPCTVDEVVCTGQPSLHLCFESTLYRRENLFGLRLLILTQELTVVYN
eukprot:m.24824 g.24824  ORF g.24824 m.24824 type:complete len:108 (+) comp11559_c0_seq1:3-326(+)